MDVSLLSSFPNAICSYLLHTTFDHSPMVIEFKMDPFSYGPSPFRFQQMWVDHPQFLMCVCQVWSASTVGHGLTKLAFKLKNTKVENWHSIFDRTTMHIHSLESHIEELENKLYQSWDEAMERDLLVSSSELDIWLRREDTRLAQMAKLKWHMEGDRNMICFHACLANKRRKRVVEMRCSNGVVFNSPESLHQGAVDFFSNFLQGMLTRSLPDLSTLISHVISDSNSSILCSVPTMNEFFLALSSILSNSAPGLDGFGLGFFKSCWEVVKEDVLEAIYEFFVSKQFPRFFTASFRVLIPKVDIPSRFDKFRPISLCSVFYKICSKIIVNRLTGLLP
ncbi:uncharacterized protein LOC121242244 [Juglans microcarpa x Juglans regia]|uniref:uncharacterized protein LOC121242244 n=1 Tax=Juglans microcarpa x Juglans regia TaxID=2249226 RepID=UPI001B7F4870|nr:uncharacterized protein LOC121242244 [Juglans microcarpa x Juglans regia]